MRACGTLRAARPVIRTFGTEVAYLNLPLPLPLFIVLGFSHAASELAVQAAPSKAVPRAMPCSTVRKTSATYHMYVVG